VESSSVKLLTCLHPAAFALFSVALTFLLYQIVGGVASWFLIGGSITEDNTQSGSWITLAGQLLLMLVPTILLRAMIRTRLEPTKRRRARQ